MLGVFVGSKVRDAGLGLKVAVSMLCGLQESYLIRALGFYCFGKEGLTEWIRLLGSRVAPVCRNRTPCR